MALGVGTDPQLTHHKVEIFVWLVNMRNSLSLWEACYVKLRWVSSLLRREISWGEASTHRTG